MERKHGAYTNDHKREACRLQVKFGTNYQGEVSGVGAWSRTQTLNQPLAGLGSQRTIV